MCTTELYRSIMENIANLVPFTPHCEHWSRSDFWRRPNDVDSSKHDPQISLSTILVHNVFATILVHLGLIENNHQKTLVKLYVVHTNF